MIWVLLVSFLNLLFNVLLRKSSDFSCVGWKEEERLYYMKFFSDFLERFDGEFQVFSC